MNGTRPGRTAALPKDTPLTRRRPSSSTTILWCSAPPSDADDAARKAAGLAPDYGATGATLRLEAAPPRGDGAQKYEEQLVLFEHSSIGFDEPQAPPYSTRADLDLPENAPVFCVLQHSKSCTRILTRPSRRY